MATRTKHETFTLNIIRVKANNDKTERVVAFPTRETGGMGDEVFL